MNSKRVILFTGPRGSDPSDSRCSLQRLSDTVDGLLLNPLSLPGKKEFIITGGWIFSKDPMSVLQAKYGNSDLESAVETEVSNEPVRTGDLTRARSQSSAGQKPTLKKHELEWSLAINLVKRILDKIHNLRSLEWESDLPFSQEIWPLVPQDIQELSINVFVPDAEDLDVHDPHPEYFTHDDFKHLINFHHLKFLRIYNMVESFQPELWEAIWKNPGLVCLELGMRDKPFTRDPDNAGKPSPAFERSWKYDPERIPADKYRGREGAGMLHHQYGHGEYLDRVAISKGRNAAMHTMGELKFLPVTVLRLANFVVDDTSFSWFFDSLDRIVFCNGCFDAGFALPKHLLGKARIFTRDNGLGAFAAGPEDEVEVKMGGEAGV